MKVALTGASGFVGSHVLQRLAVEGAQIVAVSRRSPAAERMPAGAVHVALDIAEAGADAYERLGRPDILMHLAWGGLPNYRSLHHFEAELPAQYRFLKAMVEGGLPVLLVTGTCYEYGMLDGALSEDVAAPPANPYAFAKVALHRQLEFLQAQTPFALTWARLFYMYGPGQSPRSILPLLQAAVARGDATFPMSRGEQLRDYLPVEEVARLLVALAGRRADAGVVNVCSGEPISIRALVERWIAENDWNITLDLGRYPYPDYEPLAFWGSRSKLDTLLAAEALPVGG